MWSSIQKHIEKELVHCALGRVKSMSDGAQSTRSGLLFPKAHNTWSLFVNYPIRFIKYGFIANHSRLWSRFEEELACNGYLEDNTLFAGLIGCIPSFIYRNKVMLLKKFIEKNEQTFFSNDKKYTYYVKEIWEEREGKQKQLLLYRIPPKSSTGPICFSNPWVTMISLRGTCLVINGEELYHCEQDGILDLEKIQPGFPCEEDDNITINDYCRLFGLEDRQSWFELKNETRDEFAIKRTKHCF